MWKRCWPCMVRDVGSLFLERAASEQRHAYGVAVIRASHCGSSLSHRMVCWSGTVSLSHEASTFDILFYASHSSTHFPGYISTCSEMTALIYLPALWTNYLVMSYDHLLTNFVCRRICLPRPGYFPSYYTMSFTTRYILGFPTLIIFLGTSCYAIRSRLPAIFQGLLRRIHSPCLCSPANVPAFHGRLLLPRFSISGELDVQVLFDLSQRLEWILLFEWPATFSCYYKFASLSEKRGLRPGENSAVVHRLLSNKDSFGWAGAPDHHISMYQCSRCTVGGD